MIAAWALALAALPGLAQQTGIRFEETAAEAGLRFVLDNDASPEKRYIETMPGGLALFDYDGDGLTDVFFTNGAVIDGMRKESPRHWNRLFRNEGGMKFRDVTREAGVAGEGYSIGAAAADYDNDGDTDLFVAGVDRNLLYRNAGDGTFDDVTAAAGIGGGKWAVAAAWLDYDRDGRLDLFVVNYVAWSIEADRYCGDPARGLRVYCHPKYFRELPNALYRNRGDGTFEDVSAKSGIASLPGKGMGVSTADYDQDGWPDLYVTNDYLNNFLFRNRGDGTFEETALLSGAALRDDGLTISNMGADFGDYDNDGRPDIFVVALAGQTFPMFRNLGQGMFADATIESGLARLSVGRSGWSPLLADFDNDGWKDLFVSCAHVNDRIEMLEANRYRLPNAVFRNTATGKFAAVPGSGLESGAARAHRGAMTADLDNDGRLDVVVTALGEPAELWRNIGAAGRAWLRVRLVGGRSNRQGIGARLRIGRQHSFMASSRGYSSSCDQGVHFGLGTSERVEELEIWWPSGARQSVRDIKANQLITVREPE